MGDDDRGAPGRDLQEPLVHRLLLQRIDRRRRFVQQDRVMLAEQSARDGQPLPLPEGEVAGAELARQHHVQPLRAVPQILRYATFTQRLQQPRLVSRCRRIRHDDVVAQAHLVAPIVLEHRRGRGPYRGPGSLPRIETAPCHLSGSGDVQPHQQLGEGGLAGPVGPHQGERGPAADLQIHPAHGVRVAPGVGERDLARNQAPGRCSAGAAARRAALVQAQELQQVGRRDAGPVGGAEHAHHRAGHHHQPAHRVDHHREPADADAPAGQQQRRQQERSAVTEQHEHVQPEVDHPQADVLAPVRRAIASDGGAVPLQQVGSGTEHSRFLEVLAIHQAAFQVLKLAQQRHGFSFQPVVAAAVDQVTGDAGREHQRNDQRQQRRQRKQVARRHHEEDQLVHTGTGRTAACTLRRPRPAWPAPGARGRRGSRIRRSPAAPPSRSEPLSMRLRPCLRSRPTGGRPAAPATRAARSLRRPREWGRPVRPAGRRRRLAP